MCAVMLCMVVLVCLNVFLALLIHSQLVTSVNRSTTSLYRTSLFNGRWPPFWAHRGGRGQHVASKMLFGSQKNFSDRKKKNRHSLKQNQNATFLKAKKGKKVAPLFLVHFSKKNTSQKSWKKFFFQNEKKFFFAQNHFLTIFLQVWAYLAKSWSKL